MPPVKNPCETTSYGGITRIRLKGRSSITSSQPAHTSSPVFIYVYCTSFCAYVQAFSKTFSEFNFYSLIHILKSYLPTLLSHGKNLLQVHNYLFLPIFYLIYIKQLGICLFSYHINISCHFSFELFKGLIDIFCLTNQHIKPLTISFFFKHRLVFQC